jgi:hypothetical protein
MESRILVRGKYITPKEYVLIKTDGSIFQTIRENEPFKIGNDVRSQWTPIKITLDYIGITILICRRYDDNGVIIDQFPLEDNKLGTWALTYEEAQRKLFVKYEKPTNILQETLSNICVPFSVIHTVKEINYPMVVNKYGKSILGYDESKCEEFTYIDPIKGENFIIYLHVMQTHSEPIRIYITKDTDLKKVASKVISVV